eukprot:SM000071S21044  [mRNA]  locus=s71:3271:4609:- [translate_table: standard]
MAAPRVPRAGTLWLDVVKDDKVVDRIPLERRRALFGRQATAVDFVLDHPSVSRQHAVVVPHKNGRVFVFDLGSAHGTFVSNERLGKDGPTELEVGQSLRFAASTRSYILRRQTLVERPVSEADLPLPPDPTDEDAVLAYNTAVNKLGLPRSPHAGGAVSDEARQSTQRPPGADGGSAHLSEADGHSSGLGSGNAEPNGSRKRSNEAAVDEQRRSKAKHPRSRRVSFRDDLGGSLADFMGYSDGADVSFEPGPVGAKEGSSLRGKYELLVQSVVIPNSSASCGGGGEETAKVQANGGEAAVTTPKVTDKLRAYLTKVKSPPAGGLYGGLLGEAEAAAGRLWASPEAQPATPSVKPMKSVDRKA